MKSLLQIVIFLSLAAHAMAQGKIAGKVQDAANGDPLIGCNVILSGTKWGASTDLDGNFIIFNVPEGSYTVDFTYISYQRKQVHAVHVTNGLTTTLHVSLQPEAIEGDEIVVEATASRSQETGILLSQKKSVKVMDGISSEQISKTSDGNAGAALKRVTGVSLIGGKDVYVRGLGNRYSNVQLNGSTIPSTNPNQKETPLDIFSSNVLDNIVVQKTYTADQPGEFSGGSVQIFTKDFPENRTLRFSVSSSFNSETSGKSFLSYKGGKTDFLGFDDGTRKLPSIAEQGRINQDLGATAVGQFQNVWTPSKKSSLPAQSYGLSYTDVIDLGEERQLGIVASGNYSYSNQAREEIKGNLFQIKSFGSLYDVERGLTNTLSTGLLNVYYKFSPTSKVGIKNLFTNSSEKSAGTMQGFYYNNEPGADYRLSQLKFVQRTVQSTNVQYDTYLRDFLDSRVVAEFSYAAARAYEPDTRSTHYSENLQTGEFDAVLDLRNNFHLFSDQKDRDLNFRLNWDMKIADKIRMKAGGFVMDKNRDFEARRFAISNDPLHPYPAGLLSEQAEVVFDASMFNGNGLVFAENTRTSDSYKGAQNLYAGYVSSEWKALSNLEVVTGLRVENSNQRMNGRSTIATVDALPSVNLTYRITNSQNLRMAYAMTLARPEFREISNFFWTDFIGSTTVFGNPDLKRTRIFNYDVRWELFPGFNEMFSVSGFYKYFTNAIEMLSRQSGNAEATLVNAPSARLYGMEFEVRKTIIDPLRVSGNLTLIHSEVDYGNNAFGQANAKRPMFGQSPYTVNLNAFYAMKTGTEMTLSYNRFGKRISTVGSVNQGDDQYEMPFDKLDFSASQRLHKYTVKLNIQNILNDRIVHKQDGLVTNRYKMGVTYSLGASYDF